MRLDLGRPAVMAIVNVTPDSFFADSRTPDGEALRHRIRQVAAEGADVIDVGGYSSRPGADDVSPEEELRRVSRALAIIREELPEAVVSIDTFRASVAEGVMARYGTCIVNDIAAGELGSADHGRGGALWSPLYCHAHAGHAGRHAGPYRLW